MNLKQELIKHLGLRNNVSEREIIYELIKKLKEKTDKKEGISLKGEIEILVYDKNGNLKEHRKIRNLIVDVGKAQVAGLINGVVTTAFTYVAIGTGTTAPSSSDTALENEVARTVATTGRTTTNVTNDTATWDATFNFTSSYAITEAGIFDSSTGGNMLARQTFSAINVQSGDTLTISWKIQVS